MKIKYVWLKRHRQRYKNKFVSTIVLGWIYVLPK
jgi:uncharacterized membrane protein YesL